MVAEKSPGVFESSNGAYFLEDGGAVVTYSQDIKPLHGLSTPLAQITVSGKPQALKYAKWGKNNDEPNVRENLIADNNILPELLRAKTYMLLGSDLMMYRERVENNQVIREEVAKNAQAKEFIEEFEIMQFRHDAASELVNQGQFYDEINMNAGSKLQDAELRRCRYVRAQEIAKSDETKRQRINHWLLSGDWKNRKSQVDAVRSFQGLSKKTNKRHYIRRYADSLLGGPYYFQPAWWGSRKWVQLANCIPEFHLANIANGYTIRFHVQFPKDYFVTENVRGGVITEDDKKKIIEDSDARRDAFMAKMNSYLAGLKNTGRAIFTTYDTQKALGKEFPGVKITPISADLKDEAMLKLFDKSNQAIVSGQGILPSVSGVETPGKLSSGSDIRNALAFYLITKTSEPRRILHDAVNHRAKLAGLFNSEGYEDVRFGARDMIITTTDKNSSGRETMNPNNQPNAPTL